jgi:hypothetical protein
MKYALLEKSALIYPCMDNTIRGHLHGFISLILDKIKEFFR